MSDSKDVTAPNKKMKKSSVLLDDSSLISAGQGRAVHPPKGSGRSGHFFRSEVVGVKPLDAWSEVEVETVDLPSVSSKKPSTISSETDEAWRRNVVMLNAHQCRRWALNPRRVILEEDTLSLIDLIQKDGQLEPIVVIKSKEKGTYDIVSGQRRWLAIQRSNFNDGKIKAVIAPDDLALEDLVRMGTQIQENTRPLTDIDRAMHVVELDRLGLDPISHFNRHKASISKLRKIGKLPERITDFMVENAEFFPCETAYFVCLYMDKTNEIAAYDFAVQLTKKRMSQEEMKRRLALVSGEAKRKTRRAWDEVSLGNKDFQFGFFKQRLNTGDVRVELQGMKPESLAMLKDFIDELTKNPDKHFDPKLLPTKENSNSE